MHGLGLVMGGFVWRILVFVSCSSKFLAYPLVYPAGIMFGNVCSLAKGL